MPQMKLTSLLLGAGVGLVAAHPAPFWPFEHHHHHKASGGAGFNGTARSTAVPVFSASTLAVTGSAGIFPSSPAAATGTAPAGGFSFTFSSSAVAVETSAVPPAPSSIAITSAPAASSAVGLSTDATSSAVSAAASGSLVEIDAASSCTFTEASAASASKTACTNIVLSNIQVPAGNTLDMTDLTKGTTVTFEGTTTFGYKEWDGPLVSFSGTDITIQGDSGHVLDGGGAQWWDGKGGNGGKTKPKFFYAHDLTDSTITGLNIKNTPVQCFSVDGASNLKITDVTIDDSDGNTDNLAANTDAFDIGDSTGVYISGATVSNQDDCVAINSGTDITFTGGSCTGSHGLSIGSVGGRSDNTVENILFSNSKVSGGENGVRIKTISGDTGSVKNVTFSGITLSGITDYGVVIEQDYENGDPTGTPTAGVPVTEITLEDISGDVADEAVPYYILCASCSDWTVSSVDITGGTASTKCEGVPSGVSLC